MQIYNNSFSLYLIVTLLSLSFLILPVSLSYSQNDKINPQLTIDADYIAYTFEKNIIQATSNVILTIKGIKINADSLQLDINERFLQAQGNIVISSLIDETPGEISTITKTLQGDFLRLNLTVFQGELIKIAQKIEVIYFISENLNIIHSPIEKLDYSIELPDLTRASLSLVAKRINLTFGSDRMSLDDVKFYVKGKKVASLPYYSTEVTAALKEIPLKLENISYSSKDKWEIDSSLHYAKGKKTDGYIDIKYNSKKDKFTLNLEQHFTFGKNKDGVIYINRLGEGKNENYFINYRHFFNKYTTINLALSYLHKKNINGRINSNLRFKNSYMNILINATSLDKKANYNYNINMNSYSILDKDTKIGYNWNINVNKQENSKEIPKRITFNIYKSGIYLSNTTSLNINTNISYTLEKESTTSFNYNIGLIKGVTNLGSLRCGYSYNLTKKYEKLTSSNLSIGLAVGKRDLWNANIDTSYNLKKDKLGSITQTLQVRPNKLLRIIINSQYDKYTKPHWTNVTLTAYYQLFGIKDKRRLEGNWNIKKKEYFIELNTRI